ncbi:transcription factor IIIC subunit delta N-term-domain-containing protein [Suillus spraguei]|nr:transcription factor IIIC subunit delta N-term-domain-containing protein [Suillus spraguei]
MAIYTSLAVPTVILNPSERCLQWSDDGQACITTKAAVHIMTPDLGINFSTPPDIKALPGDEQGEQPLGWFRTIIEPARGQTHMWPSICQDWGAITLGSLDVSLREVACSPSNLTSRGRCVIAILNSNAEVSLWVAAKNHLKGEWTNVRTVTHVALFRVLNFVEIQDVTGLLLNTASSEDIIRNTLRAQVTSLAWSKQPDYRITPTPVLDSSMLALGNRAGCIEFFRFNRNSNSGGFLLHIHTEPLSNHWITRLSWAPWITHSIGFCESLLAFSTDNGNIGLVKVTQNLQSTPNGSFVPEYTISAVFDVQDPICEADKRSVTALTWVQPPGRNVTFDVLSSILLGSDRIFQPILVYTKPGLVHLWSWPGSEPTWYGTRVLPFQTQNMSVGSSAISPVSGVSYVLHRDALILSLVDGSLHAIHNMTMGPTWSSPLAGDILTSAELSRASRALIGGMASYDSQSTLIWIYESLRPTDFGYKHEAQHECMLLTAPFWQLDDETVLHTASEAFADISCASGSAPIYHLRALMLHLRSNARFAALLPQKLCKDPEMQTQCGQVAQGLLAAISHCVLRVLIRHLKAIVSVITAPDIPFVLREVVQSLLPGSPQDLADEAQALSDILTASFSIDPAIAALHEHCPACHAEVPLRDITRATCPNGHAWGTPPSFGKA